MKMENNYKISSMLAIIILQLLFSSIYADPIVDYKQGSNGRAEYVHAKIYKKHLDTGMSKCPYGMYVTSK